MSVMARRIYKVQAVLQAYSGRNMQENSFLYIHEDPQRGQRHTVSPGPRNGARAVGHLLVTPSSPELRSRQDLQYDECRVGFEYRTGGLAELA